MWVLVKNLIKLTKTDISNQKSILTPQNQQK